MTCSTRESWACRGAVARTAAGSSESLRLWHRFGQAGDLQPCDGLDVSQHRAHDRVTDDDLGPRLPSVGGSSLTIDDQRKHLEFIQAVITRMSTNSFVLKGWSVTLVSGLFALAATGANPFFVYIAYFPAFAFWSLDGYFLWQERLFRKLYDEVRQRKPEATDYSMVTTGFQQVSTWWSAFSSVTLRLFHGTIVLRSGFTTSD